MRLLKEYVRHRAGRTWFGPFVVGLSCVGAVAALTPASASVAVPKTVALIDSKFIFAVVPDTQQEVKSAHDARLRNRTSWLVNNRSALDLRFVTHTGDLVNWDTPDHYMYVTAADGLKVLQDARITYSVAPGNHDTAAVCAGGGACDTSRTKDLLRDTRTFNRYLKAAQFGAVAEQFEAGKVDNALSTFSAGGLNWGVLTLELWPRTAVVDWARRIVAGHPHHNIVIATHSYLNADATISNRAEYGATSPQYLFDNLVKRYPNIKVVVSGHTGTGASRQDTGVNGNRIYSFLGAFHDEKTNPVRLIEVDTAGNTITSRVYAPYTDTRFPQFTTSSSGVVWAR
jgi:3',5'-cyclic AMP phosphodiesterase CpdA